MQAVRVQVSDFLYAQSSAGAAVLPCLTALLSTWPTAVPPLRSQLEGKASTSSMYPCPADEELTADMEHGIQLPLPSQSVSGLHLQLQNLSGAHAEPSVCSVTQSAAVLPGPMQQPQGKTGALPTSPHGPLPRSLMASFLQRLGHKLWAWPAHQVRSGLEVDD